MRLNYKALIGIVCVLVGIVLIIYANHNLHEQQLLQHAAEKTKGFFERTGDFFSHLWKEITGTKEQLPSLPHASSKSLKMLLWSGIFLSGIGVLVLIFSIRREKY
ncbi:MAG TPA: hypothetical protein VGJ00_07705 [Rhabdochlamydiaceae bacterium]|jgi:drug/metabolite transporter (DMT)-like permease